MTKILMKLLFLSLLYIPVILSANSSPKSIQYYNQLHQRNLGPDYKILKKKGHYITYNSSWYPDELYLNKTLLDSEKRSIYILDEGTGGGSYEEQFTLFHEKSAIFTGLAKASFSFGIDESIYPTFTKIILFEKSENNSWHKSYDQVWMGTSIIDFLPNDFTIKDVHYLKSHFDPHLYYILPKNGKQGSIQLHLNIRLSDKTCQTGTNILTKNILDFYCKKIKHKMTRILYIQWNTKTYQFEITGSSKKEPFTLIEKTN